MLELLHVEKLEWFVHLQQSVGQFEDVVADGSLLGCVLDVDVGLADPLDQDVAAVVHLELAARPNLGLELRDLVVPHRVLKPIDADPEPIKPVLRPTDRQDGGPGVGLGDPPVPLKDNHFGPNLVIDIVPLLKNLRDVILELETVGQWQSGHRGEEE